MSGPRSRTPTGFIWLCRPAPRVLQHSGDEWSGRRDSNPRDSAWKAGGHHWPTSAYGRCSEIRTRGLLLPKQALCQAELRTVELHPLPGLWEPPESPGRRSPALHQAKGRRAVLRGIQGPGIASVFIRETGSRGCPWLPGWRASPIRDRRSRMEPPVGFKPTTRRL